jgi:hypothetical protein
VFSQRVNKRTPAAGSVAAAWSDPILGLRSVVASETGLKQRSSWDMFVATYGGKCSAVDAEGAVTLPAIIKTMMAKTGWFEDFFEIIKPRLEAVHCMALVLGDEALEDFGPQPAAEPTYNSGQASQLKELVELLEMSEFVKSSTAAGLEAVQATKGTIVIRYQAEMQRAISYFRRRRAVAFEALATAIFGSD